MSTKLDAFTQAYIDAALWSGTAYGSPDDPGDEAGTFDTSFQDANYDADDLSPELLAHVVADCADFQAANADLLSQAYDLYSTRWSGPEMAGHDFWLTRNRHGAGFWDRGLGDIGDKLTTAARAYGEEYWYVVRDTADPNDYGTIHGG